ncbi:hypothetical protein BDV23DRAFT_174359 [Aspergillus alliaceus]|uniref:Uncharacterized protein n=1 Tax=Petromyces alliaceus TaxID=209559 RepID=A0A5N7C1C0_PETAA|nr:hypothetical protein BDV23DRAFT_174359 [Aspergillus alliaceus]
MIKLAALSLAVLATLAPLAAANNCKTGLNYCGYNLLGIGNYGAQVNGALKAAHQPTDDAHTRESLFLCNGGNNDGGCGRNDYC